MNTKPGMRVTVYIRMKMNQQTTGALKAFF